ncbi:MAG: PAS domain-containing protein, partial [Acidobacteria bacterium]|nr:PAS domain-containing protein [Acidobacteriota bacterium]
MNSAALPPNPSTLLDDESLGLGRACLDRTGKLVNFDRPFQRLMESLNRPLPPAGTDFAALLPDRGWRDPPPTLIRRALDGHGTTATLRLPAPPTERIVRFFFLPRRVAGGAISGVTVLTFELDCGSADPVTLPAIPADAGAAMAPGPAHPPDPAVTLFRRAVEQVKEGVLILTTDGTILYANPATEQILRVSRDEGVGLTLPELMHRHQWLGSDPSMAANLAAGRPWQGTFRSLNRRQRTTDLELELTPLFDESGDAAHFLGICRDLSAEVRLERQLRQAQKLEALGTLAGGIAHDFNNILGMILGYTELALLDAPENTTTREHLEQVLAASRRARDLIRQILVFSRRQADEPQPLRIGAVVRDALKLIRSSLPATIQIQEYISSAPYLVIADPTHIHQVLLNLVTNAAHAMADRGVLKVELYEALPGEDTGAANRESALSRYVRLSVSDTGHGMGPEVRERIFEPFYTTKQNGEGTGLGLSVVQGIVDSYCGRIRVISSPGEGSTFSVELPLYRLTPEPAPSPDGESPPGSGRILLV